MKNSDGEDVVVISHLQCDNPEKHLSHEWVAEDGKYFCNGVDVIEKQFCVRCKKSFYPASEQLPKTCPKCRSPYWNKPRQVKGFNPIVSV